MDISMFDACFVLAFVGIGIARGYAETVEKNLDKTLRVIVHNISESKWKSMCEKYFRDTTE
jgi:hypothetical protein